jgi:hypothetical protein
LFNEIGLLLIDGQSFQKRVCFDSLLLEFRLEFGHLHFEFGDDLIGGLQLFEPFREYFFVGIDLLFLRLQRDVKQFHLIQESLWSSLYFSSFR